MVVGAQEKSPSARIFAGAREKRGRIAGKETPRSQGAQQRREEEEREQPKEAGALPHGATAPASPSFRKRGGIAEPEALAKVPRARLQGYGVDNNADSNNVDSVDKCPL